jgi:hypothetical protein
LKLSLRDPVEYLEIVKNDEVIKRVRLSDYARRRGMLPPITFKRSGWMLIRAVSSHSKTYRFATTGPYYVKIGSRNRVSKSSAQFFANWVKQRMAQLEKSRELRSQTQREEVLKPHRIALQFWRDLVNQATAP